MHDLTWLSTLFAQESSGPLKDINHILMQCDYSSVVSLGEILWQLQDSIFLSWGLGRAL
ncbi:hypothetical protein Csa_009253 [Cucumis sativus]|uniref:Uncharacterized protein n=1 Tax=Cucumis sativus TaxID=3659 RepID=A0A0A0KS56_CUCSA|nr:hypothetical protein Csa_009253 [Cucumis sativus]